MTRRRIAWALLLGLVVLIIAGIHAGYAPAWAALAGLGVAALWDRPARPVRHPVVCAVPLVDDWDAGSGRDFERRVATALARIGWAVRPTPITGDFGADLVGTDAVGTAWVIQCKHTRGSVGVAAVQEVLGARAFYATPHALVVTTGHFTRAAWTLADRAHVTLWDRGAVLALRDQAARVPAPR